MASKNTQASLPSDEIASTDLIFQLISNLFKNLSDSSNEQPGKKHDADPNGNTQKWVVITFGTICVIVLIICFVLILTTTIRRRRMRQMRQSEDRRLSISSGIGSKRRLSRENSPGSSKQSRRGSGKSPTSKSRSKSQRQYEQQQ